MNKRKFTIRQQVQKWYQECFDNYNEEEFSIFFSKVMKKCDEGYSLNNAFCYYQINQHYEEVGKETLHYETKD